MDDLKEFEELNKETLENKEEKDTSIDDLENAIEGKALEEKELTVDELEDAMEGKSTETDEELLPMESIVECETLYDYKCLKYTNMYVIRIKRKSFIISIVMTVITFLIAGGLLTYGLINKTTNNYWVAGIIFLLGVWTLFNTLNEENKIDKQLKKYFLTNKPFTQKFSINKDKIRVEVTAREKTQKADYPWAYVSSIDVIPEYYFLFTNNGAPLVIDKNALCFKKGTLQDLEDIIKEEASLKPFKYYDKPVVKKLIDVTYPVSMDDEVENKDNLE